MIYQIQNIIKVYIPKDKNRFHPIKIILRKIIKIVLHLQKIKRKKNEVINYKKELLKIDLSKTKLSSRNKVLNFSLNKLSNNKYSNNTNHNSFIFKNNKSYSKNNILNNTNVANYNIKKYSNINYNVFNSYSRNKSLKNVVK